MRLYLIHVYRHDWVWRFGVAPEGGLFGVLSSHFGNTKIEYMHSHTWIHTYVRPLGHLYARSACVQVPLCT